MSPDPVEFWKAKVVFKVGADDLVVKTERVRVVGKTRVYYKIQGGSELWGGLSKLRRFRSSGAPLEYPESEREAVKNEYRRAKYREIRTVQECTVLNQWLRDH